MIDLWRAVTMSEIYRQIRERLHNREPDDVWYDPQLGWMLAFALIGPEAEHLALFVVRPPEHNARAMLRRVMEVSHSGEETEVRLLWGA